MKKIKEIYTKIGFESYMAPYVVMFTLLYLIGAIKFIVMITSVKGLLIYIAYLIGGAILIYAFLRVFQAISSLLGVKKIISQLKKK